MSDEKSKPRLIEVAFPLKQTSIDAVHEKNVRHGHISTLHIWPARRPLAASRAALIATLLPDPGNPDERRALLERLGGKLVSRFERKKVRGTVVENRREETEGGVLHWGQEGSPDVEWFREKIRSAYGDRSPSFLDPFAGGGAIPLEAMRLGCATTAVDINPVAWFTLKCTLEYPQMLAGQTFALPTPETSGGTTSGRTSAASSKRRKKSHPEPARAVEQGEMFDGAPADLAAHVRYWGRWVLARAKDALGAFYPNTGTEPTVAYLWAKTITCKNCRSIIPLLKTKWLCRKEDKKVFLDVTYPERGGRPAFDVKRDRVNRQLNAAQRRDHERKVGRGSMSRAGATCPVCGVISTMEDIRLEGKAKKIGSVMTSVVVDAPGGKNYRAPTKQERERAEEAEKRCAKVFAELPFGVPTEPIITGSIKKGTVSVTRWGVDSFGDLFNPRQLLALGTFTTIIRGARQEMRRHGYPEEWVVAISAYLAATLDRLANQSSVVARWNMGGENIEGTFAMFALPMMWDYAEVNPLGDTTGGYASAVEWVSLAVEHLLAAVPHAPKPRVLRQSAATPLPSGVDVIITDPPYYNAIPYASLMDFFYVWLRRCVSDLDDEYRRIFSGGVPLQWDHKTADGELIDDESRFGGDSALSKSAYEDGMYKAFRAAHDALVPDGRLVVVFAHKKPDAWETLVSAIIRAGFVVDGSWPIQTERLARGRSLAGAALSSSVWLVCKKRPEIARPGWDNRVLDDMRERIYARLRDFWDAGIRGPDFVWAATGPALEAYSRHPVVKKANEPGQILSVGEFLRHVRRIVVDYVVGRVLTRDGADRNALGLDDVTTYYLLHRHDFGFADAPAGACILYAVSCGLSDHDLSDSFDLLSRTGGETAGDEEVDDESEDETASEGEGSRSKMRLRRWDERKRKSMGFDSEGRPAPLIDQAHRLMHLWKAGDVAKVDEYLEARALKKNQVFHKLLQALIELAEGGSEERAMLESISNHLAVQPSRDDRQRTIFESEGNA